MIPLELSIGAIMLASIIIYALTGGADFGGGAWDLLATGPRRAAQRKLVAEAIAPIWEANHVWLIVVIVLLFTCFAPAFSAIMIALHIPVTIMLVGIVLRGSAFAFRAYGISSPGMRKTYERVFAISSMVTPVMLGIVLGAVASGAIRVDLTTGRVMTNFFDAWLAPFPIALGFFTLALFVFLAAVYLILETDDPGLRADFRRRALMTAVVVGILAWVTLGVAHSVAPRIYAGLTRQPWSMPFQIVTGLTAVAVILSLWFRYYAAARALAILQVTLILLGWGLVQYPYIVPPDLTLYNTAAPISILRPVLIILSLGLLIIGPAFWWLYSIFKGHQADRQASDAGEAGAHEQ